MKLLLGVLLLLGYQIALLFHLSAALHTHVQMRSYLLIRTRVQKETSFRDLVEQLRAMKEHDKTAPAAFRFLYSTSTKKVCLFFMIVIIKKYAVNKFSLKSGSSWGTV